MLTFCLAACYGIVVEQNEKTKAAFIKLMMELYPVLEMLSKDNPAAFSELVDTMQRAMIRSGYLGGAAIKREFDALVEQGQDDVK